MSPHTLCPSADGALRLFTVTNHSHEHDHLLSPVSLPSDSSDWGWSRGHPPSRPGTKLYTSQESKSNCNVHSAHFESRKKGWIMPIEGTGCSKSSGKFSNRKKKGGGDLAFQKAKRVGCCFPPNTGSPPNRTGAWTVSSNGAHIRCLLIYLQISP